MASFFKIRNSAGLFSKGGQYINWSKTGKTWNMIGHVSSHFSGLGQRELREYIDAGAEVVEYEMVEKSATPASVFGAAAKERAEERERVAAERRMSWQEKLEIEELKRLQAKYGQPK